MRAVPSRRIRVAHVGSEFEAVSGSGFGTAEVTCPDVEHHVDGRDDVADRGKVALAQQAAQFIEVPADVRVSFQQEVDGAPQHAHDHVAATAGADALGDERVGDLCPQGGVVRPEQAVVQKVERLGDGGRIRAAAGFVRDGADGLVRRPAMVGFGGDARTQAQRQHRVRRCGRQCPTEPVLRDRGAGGAAMFVDPQARPPEGGHGHGVGVVALLGLPVGRVEDLPAAVRLAVAP
ncbi:hypothetical protein MPTA5024_01870 [Microbispora sp. ATCC PTA-5024]|nr:hypothetical protein MPTA5024_01870 [Microbispora sp. ATCC PTA-5024]